MIEISPTAAREIKRIRAIRQKPDSPLRIKVEKGGCSGLFYCLELESSSSKQSSESESSEHYFQSNGVSIIVDPQSYLYLKGSKLDYAEDLMGGGFRFQNPNVSETCGCGISFSGDLENQS